MDGKLRSNVGPAIYALRKATVEPALGDIKGAKGQDRFRLQRLEMVHGEWPLMTTTHNLLKLFRTSMALACGLGSSSRTVIGYI